MLCLRSLKRPVIMYEFPKGKLEPVLFAAATILLSRKDQFAASILANAAATLTHCDHDNWNGGQETWKLHLGIAPETYLGLQDKEGIEKALDEAIAIPMVAVSHSDSIMTEITTTLDHGPDWRLRIRQQLFGQGITDQGRARIDNIAFIEREGLRFRSRAEVHFYQAMKATGITVAPLPVVIHGGIQYKRIEPDFVVIKQGIVMVVEIDGGPFHTEKPSDAHARLKFLSDEGVVVERISHTSCDTPEKAREAARGIIASLERHKAAR